MSMARFEQTTVELAKFADEAATDHVKLKLSALKCGMASVN